MKELIIDLKNQILQEIKDVKEKDKIEDIKVKYLGKKRKIYKYFKKHVFSF